MDVNEHIKKYHRQSSHQLNRYAPGPETIDWDQQPDSFRRYESCELIYLNRDLGRITTPVSGLWNATSRQTVEIGADNIGSFLRLAMGISAWKSHGGATWSVRNNPSSGNLHPTECYLLLPQLPDLNAGLYHYAVEPHALELRGSPNSDTDTATNKVSGDGFLLLLSSIPWRETWKYGIRGYRYCQLDIGHALMAINAAASCHGWSVRPLEQFSVSQLQYLFGFDRHEDFHSDEREYAELLLHISPSGDQLTPLRVPPLSFTGQANRLDNKHFYSWPLVDEMFSCSLGQPTFDKGSSPSDTSALSISSSATASEIIQNRRSAVRYSSAGIMQFSAFKQFIYSMLPSVDNALWSAYPARSGVSLVFFIHSVEGLRPGLYVLTREPEHEQALRMEMKQEFDWEHVEGIEDTLYFYRLVAANSRNAAGVLSCQQRIASEGCFAVSMLSDWRLIKDNSFWYRQLHWEAGYIGQIMYLIAESLGYGGTGIGCFFDTEVSEIFGLNNSSFRPVYHFTVGVPVEDNRISTLPAYT